MDSPLVRVILSLLGGYLAILLVWTTYGWIREEYPRPNVTSPCNRSVHHPYYHDRAKEVLHHFAELPHSESAKIKQSLETSLISMQQWLTGFDRSNCQILCLGEQHEESTRRFLAEAFFSTAKIDVLFLEATPKEVGRLIDRSHAGRDYFPLLEADMLKILRSTTQRNPHIGIYGIEETAKQRAAQRNQTGSRDRSIASNFWESFTPNRRHVVLFGALHCANRTDWLYDLLSRQASPGLKSKMLNVCVVEEHQHGPLEAFVYFLDQIGVEVADFVLPDTRALHHRIYAWFPYLDQRFLEQYRTLMVFRACHT